MLFCQVFFMFFDYLDHLRVKDAPNRRHRLMKRGQLMICNPRSNKEAASEIGDSPQFL